MFACYYSLYGSVLSDLNNRYDECVCITRRKGLRQACSLPLDTHCALLPVLSNTLPVIDELAKRSVRLILFRNVCTVIVMLLDLLQIMMYSICRAYMFHRLSIMLSFCCSRFGFATDDITRLAPTEISTFIVLLVVI